MRRPRNRAGIAPAAGGLALRLCVPCLVLGCAVESMGEPNKPDDARIDPPMENPSLTASGIATLEQEKATRSAAQQKLDSNIVLALRQSRGEPPFDQPSALQPALTLRPDGRVLVDLDATVSAGLLAYIKHIGGEVINSFEATRAVRAAPVAA